MTMIGLFTCCFVVQLFIHIRSIMSSLILKSSQLIEEEILVKKRNLSLENRLSRDLENQRKFSTIF